MWTMPASVLLTSTVPDSVASAMLMGVVRRNRCVDVVKAGRVDAAVSRGAAKSDLRAARERGLMRGYMRLEAGYLK